MITRTNNIRAFEVENTRLFSQVIAFLVLYADYCYLVLPTSSYLSSCLLSIVVFLLIIALHNTITMDPGSISSSWSKLIETKLSKAIETEEEFIRANENTNIHVMELNNSNNKKEDSADISKFIEPSSQEEDLYMRAFSNIMRENKDKFRFCDKCEVFKPELAKHCYICRRCTVGLGHHDKILGKCIGVDNKKCYLLSIFYSTVAYLWIFNGFWNEGLYNVREESLMDFGAFCLGIVISLALFVVYGLILCFFLALEVWGVGMKDYYKGKKRGRRDKINWMVWMWFSPFQTKIKKSQEWFEEELKEKDLL